MLDDKHRKKKEFLEKLRKLEDETRTEGLVRYLQNLEKELEREGLLTGDIQRILVSTRARLGLPEFVGTVGEAGKSRDALKLDVISTLKEKGGIVRIDDLKKILAKKGWEFGSLSLERFLFSMAKKGEIMVKKGYVWQGDLEDTYLGRAFLEYIRKEKELDIKAVCGKLELDIELCKLMVEAFKSKGLIVYDGKKVYSTT